MTRKAIMQSQSSTPRNWAEERSTSMKLVPRLRAAAVAAAGVDAAAAAVAVVAAALAGNRLQLIKFLYGPQSSLGAVCICPHIFNRRAAFCQYTFFRTASDKPNPEIRHRPCGGTFAVE